jgi:hypothetical protein
MLGDFKVRQVTLIGLPLIDVILCVRSFIAAQRWGKV